jgi:hypothetical protein
MVTGVLLLGGAGESMRVRVCGWVCVVFARV